MTLLIADRPERGLLDHFREFHAELYRVKSALSVGARALSGRDNAVDGDLSIIVHRRLRIFLERQAIEAAHYGGTYGASLYREAQYVMAALADEVLLHQVEWEGKARWKDNLIETALFQTQIAGERIFDRLDAMLRENASLNAELATIYLIALSLGFRGRYRGETDDAQLRRYRRALGHAIVQRNPRYAGEIDHLFPTAYAHTLDHGKAVRLPHVRPWLMLLAGIAVVYLIASHALWFHLTKSIETIIQSVALI